MIEIRIMGCSRGIAAKLAQAVRSGLDTKLGIRRATIVPSATLSQGEALSEGEDDFLVDLIEGSAQVIITADTEAVPLPVETPPVTKTGAYLKLNDGFFVCADEIRSLIPAAHKTHHQLVFSARTIWITTDPDDAVNGDNQLVSAEGMRALLAFLEERVG